MFVNVLTPEKGVTENFQTEQSWALTQAVSQEADGKEACIPERESNTDKDRVKKNYSMKVESRKVCKFGKQHLFGEAADNEIAETGRLCTALSSI